MRQVRPAGQVVFQRRSLPLEIRLAEHEPKPVIVADDLDAELQGSQRTQARRSSGEDRYQQSVSIPDRPTLRSVEIRNAWSINASPQL